MSEMIRCLKPWFLVLVLAAPALSQSAPPRDAEIYSDNPPNGYALDSCSPNILGCRAVARPFHMHEMGRHRAIRDFQRRTWRESAMERPSLLAASLCAHCGPLATGRRARWDAGGTPGPQSVGAT